LTQVEFRNWRHLRVSLRVGRAVARRSSAFRLCLGRKTRPTVRSGSKA
jgi:hypothetical protein